MDTQIPAAALTPVNPDPCGIEGIRSYLFSVAAKKATWGVAKLLTALFSSVAVQSLMTKYGIHVDQAVFVASATSALMALLEMAHDYAKLKTGWAWL